MKYKEGQPCPKCDKDILQKEFSKSKTVDWYLKCNACSTVFFVEEGKKTTKISEQIRLNAKLLAKNKKISAMHYIESILDFLDNQ